MEHPISDQVARADSETALAQVTIEIPADLAEHIAVCCAKRGAQMVLALREVIEERFPLPPR